MLHVWVHDCDPGRVSDGSRLALCQTLSIECPSLYFSGMCILLFLFLSLCRFCLFVFFLCSHYWSFYFVHVPLIFFCPADQDVPDWQPRSILLGMVEARSDNVKKTTTTTATEIMGELTREGTAEPVFQDQNEILRREWRQGILNKSFSV